MSGKLQCSYISKCTRGEMEMFWRSVAEYSRWKETEKMKSVTRVRAQIWNLELYWLSTREPLVDMMPCSSNDFFSCVCLNIFQLEVCSSTWPLCVQVELPSTVITFWSWRKVLSVILRLEYSEIRSGGWINCFYQRWWFMVFRSGEGTRRS